MSVLEIPANSRECSLRRDLPAPAKKQANKPAPPSTAPITLSRPLRCAEAKGVTFSMLVAALLAGVTVAGSTEHTTPAGAVHDKVTVLANPFAGMIVSVKLAACRATGRTRE